MELKNIITFKKFKEIKNINEDIDLLLEEADGLVRDYGSNKSNFSTTVLGRGVQTLFKFLNKGKNYAKMYFHQKRFRNELAMGVLRVWKEIQDAINKYPDIQICPDSVCGGGTGMDSSTKPGDGPGDGPGGGGPGGGPGGGKWFIYKMSSDIIVLVREDQEQDEEEQVQKGVLSVREFYNLGRNANVDKGRSYHVKKSELQEVSDKVSQAISILFKFGMGITTVENYEIEVKEKLDSNDSDYKKCPVFKSNLEKVLKKLDEMENKTQVALNCIEYLTTLNESVIYYGYGVLNEKEKSTRYSISNLRHSKQEGAWWRKGARTLGRSAPVEILGDDTKLDWGIFSEDENINQMCCFYTNGMYYCDGSGNTLIQISGEDLKKSATSKVNKDSIAAIQYSILSAIQHTDSVDSTKMFATKGGGINDQSSTTGLDRVWRRMVSNTLAEFKCFLNTTELNPYDIAKKIKPDSGEVEKITKFTSEADRHARHMSDILKWLKNPSNKKGTSCLVEFLNGDNKYRLILFDNTNPKGTIVYNKIYNFDDGVNVNHKGHINHHSNKSDNFKFPDGGTNKGKNFNSLRGGNLLERLDSSYTAGTDYNIDITIKEVYYITDKAILDKLKNMKES